jgi:glucosamine-6-phosphate deaminase
LTGDIKKKPISDEDIAIVAAIIAKIKPHQVLLQEICRSHGTHEFA